MIYVVNGVKQNVQIDQKKLSNDQEKAKNKTHKLHGHQIIRSK